MEQMARDRVIDWLNDKCSKNYDNGLCDICKIGDYFDCNTGCFKDLSNVELADLYAKVRCATNDKPADEKTNDPVNHPSHYTKGGIECIDAIRASMSDEEFKGFLKGNSIKYLWRYSYKGFAIQDLDKAEFYLKKLRSIVEEESNNGN